MRKLLLLATVAAAFALPNVVHAQNGPCVDGIMQCADGTWSTCYFGCPVLNCPGDIGCPGRPPALRHARPFTPVSATMRRRRFSQYDSDNPLPLGDPGNPPNMCIYPPGLLLPCIWSANLESRLLPAAEQRSRYQVGMRALSRAIARKLLADDSPQIVVPTDCPGGQGCPGGNPNDPPQPCYQGNDPMIQCPTGIIGTRG